MRVDRRSAKAEPPGGGRPEGARAGGARAGGGRPAGVRSGRPGSGGATGRGRPGAGRPDRAGPPRMPARVKPADRRAPTLPERVARLYERVRRAWDRPLTAYYLILGGSLLITLLGLVMVFSSSQIQALRYDLPATYYFNKQLLAAALGTVALLAGSRLPVRLLRALSYPVLVVVVALLVLVQVPGIGVEVNGSTNWISLGGPFMLQPGELAKLALVLWGADLLARKGERDLLTQWKHMLVPLIPGGLLICALIMLGRDMGTAVIIAAILFGLLWLAGAPARMFATALAAAAAAVVVFIAIAPHRMNRLACLGATDPGPEDRCWQALHGIYALASGGLFGSGLGASVEKWGELPEPHTDFIFAITGEELGLAGTLSVLMLFAALGYAGIRVAGRTEDPFVRYAAGGVTVWLMSQTAINIGAVLGLLPIAGVPLPLFSYGGSALLPTMCAVGLLIAFARSDPAARAALAMRQPGVRWSPAAVRRKTMRRPVRKRPSGER